MIGRNRRNRNRLEATGMALLITLLFALVMGLLTSIVGRLVNIPKGYEWIPIAALVIVFILSLIYQLRNIQPNNSRSQETHPKKTDKSVRILEKAQLNNPTFNGDIAGTITKTVNNGAEEDDANLS